MIHQAKGKGKKCVGRMEFIMEEILYTTQHTVYVISKLVGRVPR